MSVQRLLLFLVFAVAWSVQAEMAVPLDYQPDLSKSDIYLKYLNRTPLSGWWKVKRVSADRCDDPKDEGCVKGMTKSGYDDSDWEKDLVPGNLNRPSRFDMNTKDLNTKHSAWGGVAYYRRGFTALAMGNDERAYLHFTAVNGNFQVFVNGKKVGEGFHPYMSSMLYRSMRESFDFDVTDALIPGKENQIAVRLYHSGLPIRPWGWGNIVGILGPVYLDVRPETFAGNILITPHRDLHGITAECILGGKSGSPEGWTGEIFEWDSKRTVASVKFAPTTAFPGEDAIAASVNIPSARAWTCDEPFLYALRIRDAKGRVAGIQRFGIRTFESKNGRFLLNGNPVFLTGITHHGADEFQHFKFAYTFGFHANPDDVLRRYWRAVRNMNVNHIRHHSSLMVPISYDILDEVGILVCDELDYPMNAIMNPKSADKIDRKLFEGFCAPDGQLGDDFKNVLKFRLRYLYSHPSVVMFSFGNEIRQSDDTPDGRIGKMFHHLYDFYHSLDRQNRPCTPSSGRFWRDGSNMRRCAGEDKLDYIDTHDYSGTLSANSLGMVELSLKNFAQTVSANFKEAPPVVNGENLAFFEADYPWAFRRVWPDKNAREPNWEGIDYIFKEFREKSPECARLSYGLFRNHGTKEVICNLESCVVPNLESILGVHRTAYPLFQGYEALLGSRLFAAENWTPSMYPFRQNWTPSARGEAFRRISAGRICIFEFFGQNHFTGETLPVSAHAINDTFLKIGRAEIYYRFVDGQDKVVADGRFPVGAMDVMSRRELPVRLKTPCVPGRFRLEYGLADGSEELSRLSLAANVRERKEIFAPIVTEKKIALYDCAAKFAGMKPYSTYKTLKAFGIPFTVLKQFDSLKSFDVLVIGDESCDENVFKAAPEIRRFLEDGGRVLLMAQNTAGRIPFLPGLRFCGAGNVQFSEILRSGHPLMSGMDQSDFSRWNQSYMTIYKYFITPISPAAITIGGNSTEWGADSFGMTNAHLKVGKGDALLCQMEGSKVFEKDSSAALLVRNLLLTILDDRTRADAVAVETDGSLHISPVPAKKHLALSLASAATMAFADSKAGDGKGGWTDQGPEKDLSEFPVGGRDFDGIRFEIVDPAKNGGKGGVVVSGNGKAPFKPESTPIAVNAKVKRLLFLHTGAWIAGKAEAGEYIVRYGDGKQVVIPLKEGAEIGDWWGTKDLTQAACVWSGRNGTAGVFLFEWENPRPEEEIKDIVLKSKGNAVIGLLGLTAETI